MSLPVADGLTVTDLEGLDADDHLRRELIDGELYVTPPPGLRHQTVVTALVHALQTHVLKHGGRVWPAPTGVRLSPSTLVEPDVVALTAASLTRLDDERYITFPPDLVVEVSSVSTRRLDLVRKRSLYEHAGVGEYWFVDLDAEVVDAYRPGEDGRFGAPETIAPPGALTSTAITGFVVSVEQLLGPEASG